MLWLHIDHACTLYKSVQFTLLVAELFIFNLFNPLRLLFINFLQTCCQFVIALLFPLQDMFHGFADAEALLVKIALLLCDVPSVSMLGLLVLLVHEGKDLGRLRRYDIVSVSLLSGSIDLIVAIIHSSQQLVGKLFVLI